MSSDNEKPKLELSKKKTGDDRSSWNSPGSTSILELQTGAFRLIQGSSYRVYKEKYAAHHETHKTVKDLPYCFPKFVEFVTNYFDFFKSLEIFDSACHELIDDLVKSIQDEHTALNDRVKNWKQLEKEGKLTDDMLEEHKAMLAAREKDKAKREEETKKEEKEETKHEKSVAEHIKNDHAVFAEEKTEKPEEFLTKWNRIIFESGSEEIDGAMLPVRFWYETFMPKLLSVCTVATKEDVDFIKAVHSKDSSALEKLDNWFKETVKNNEFKEYGADVSDGWSALEPKHKLCVKQAWYLTRHYINGIQKERERGLEEGANHRDTGDLSQYVAFIDVYLDRTFVRDAGMRLSFPYFIGTATWKMLHGVAEVVAAKPAEEQPGLVEKWKVMFRVFKYVYGCPYCRHHFNAYVSLNSEVLLYPLEYLLLGWRETDDNYAEVDLEDKLRTITDGDTLAIFLWKLHNAVSSSISRKETWFHFEETPLYTSRFYPNIQAELLGDIRLDDGMVSCQDVLDYFEILRPAIAIKVLRDRLARAGTEEELAAVYKAAEPHIARMDKIARPYLKHVYGFNPELIEPEPNICESRELFARSGQYVDDRTFLRSSAK